MALHPDMLWRRKIRFMQASISACLIIQIGICHKIWLPIGRDIPIVPAFAFLRIQWGSAPDITLVSSGIAILLGLVFKPFERKLVIAWLAIMTLLVLEDITRLQSWLYIFSMLMLAGAIYHTYKFAGKFRLACTIILSGTYFWSGFLKLNMAFATKTLPWLLKPYGLEKYLEHHSTLAFIAGGLELMAGLFLLNKRLRLYGVLFLVCMHTFMLVSLGPLLLNWNKVVWPWNLEMIFILMLLYTERKKFKVVSQSYNFRELMKQPMLVAFILLFWFLPGLNLIGWWDNYLSGSLYSGKNPDAVLYFQVKDSIKLPASARQKIYPSWRDEESILNFTTWYLETTEAPCYPEPRYYRYLGSQMCACLNEPGKAGIVIRRRSPSSSEIIPDSLSCLQLLKSKASKSDLPKVH